MSELRERLSRMINTYENQIDIAEQSLKSIGIAVRYENGSYKSFADVITELIEVWKELENKPIIRQSVTTDMVGIRDSNFLQALLENIK